MLKEGIGNLEHALNSDEKYHLEERKRKLAQKYDALGKNKKITEARLAYFNTKEEVEIMLARRSEGKEKLAQRFKAIVDEEPEFISSESIFLIESKQKQLSQIRGEIILSSNEYLVAMFYNLSARNPNEYKEPQRAADFMTKGEGALQRQNYLELKTINLTLLSMLPEKEESSILKNFRGTGIG